MLGADRWKRVLLAHAMLASVGCAATAADRAVREPSAKERVALEAAFARADVNGDGRLSRQEAVHLPAIEARFDALDTNHDGYLSFEEFMIGALAVD
jgi:Ca2+-binding EF-hand superfamily protein